MKLKTIITTALLTTFMTTNVFAAISLTIDGKQLQTDVPPAVVSGRTLVPVRAIFENLGATVDWNDSTKTVTAKTASTNITLTLNSSTATVNGQQKTLDVPAQTINGRTMVPARFVAESLNCDVNWNGNSQTVAISTTKSAASEEMIEPKGDIIRAPEIIYTTSLEENGLADVIMYEIGTVKSIEKIKKYNGIYLDTENGTICMLSRDDYNFSDLKVGEVVTIYFLYLGFSGLTNTPAGMYLDKITLGDDFYEMLDEAEKDVTDYAQRLVNAIKPGEYINYSKYLAIEDGMSYVEVVEIIQTTGVLSVESGSYEIYTWHDNSYGFATVTFEDGKVISKSQSGL